MPKATDTRARILDKARELFACCGYDGVGIRQIAAAVGIRDSSLYKHFPSKQAIYDSLVAEMQSYHNRRVTALHLPLAGPGADAALYQSIDVGALVAMAKGMFLLYVEDEKAVQFRRMLTIEQFRHEQAGEAFQSFFIDMAIGYMTSLFAQLIERGHFIKADPEVMAYQFYAPMFLLWNRCDRDADETPDALRLLEAHISHFEAAYAAGKREST